MGGKLKVVGWFFGILFILFGLFLFFENAIVGLIVVVIGILMCYGGSRSGRTVTSYVSGGSSYGSGGPSTMPNRQRIEDQRSADARSMAMQAWWATSPNSPNPANPHSFVHRHHHPGH